MNAKDAAKAYFARVHAHDAEGLAKLFAEDGWLRPPPPVKQLFHGRDAIRGFYHSLFTERSPKIAIEEEKTLIGEGKVCVGIFASVHHDRREASILDVFTVNDRGEITEMAAYRRAPMKV